MSLSFSIGVKYLQQLLSSKFYIKQTLKIILKNNFIILIVEGEDIIVPKQFKYF